MSILPGTHGSQKRASGPLELGKQMVVSYHAGAGNCTWVLCKNQVLIAAELLSSLFVICLFGVFLI